MRLLAALAVSLSLVIPVEVSSGLTLNSFRYDREVLYPTSSEQSETPNACAVLDANVFAHANTGLPDFRIFAPDGKSEVPYVVTLSSTSPTSDPARIVRASSTGDHELDVDLEMPHRSYSQVNLSLNARDFVASAHVTGMRALADSHPVFLGDINLFDLTTQHLGSSMAIPMAESTFPYLHLRLKFTPAPGNAALLITPSMVASAQVPPARQAQTLYTGIAQSFSMAQRGEQTVASFRVPARVPIERVTFDLDPAEQSNFDRAVSIAASNSESGVTETGSNKPATGSEPAETLTGHISRVHLRIGDRELAQQVLSVPAVLGSNAQAPAMVEVAVQNGGQAPLKIRSVRLEMRERQLCFPASGTRVTLAYGADSVPSPTYGFARMFNASNPSRIAHLLHEHTNAFFIAPAKRRSRFERYPAFFGLSILLVISLLAVIAYRALHRGHRDSLRR